MKKRYDSGAPERYPENPAALGAELKNRKHFLTFSFSGPYWQLREWLGFEGLSMMFYDDPDFVREMLDFWKNHVSTLMKNAFKHCVPDMVHISEDMAYKGYSMLSPAMTREFLMPVWKEWGEIIRGAGVPVYAVDSDGYIGELIPLWIESGLNVCDPIEVAAGNDINVFRKKFGKNMAYRGGVDKREMAKGGRNIEREMERIMPVIKDGGYIPGCDHGVPSDVSWPDFVRYCGLLAKATGWL
jgi:uroporphyrinogen decarboxylase